MGLLQSAAPAPANPAPSAGQGMAPPAAPPPDAGTGADSDPSKGIDSGDGQPNVTPEEQAQYDQFVKNGLEIIYPKGEGDGAMVSPQVLQQLKGGDDPIDNLAHTTVHLVTSLQDSAEKSGSQIDDGVVLHAGIAILEELAEVSEAAKIHNYSQDEMQAATYRALDLYREAGEQTGQVDAKSLTDQFGQIVAADKQGNVQSVLPQIPKGGQAAQPPAGGTDDGGSNG